MTENEVIEVLKNEKECVLRNIKGCNRDCGKCDLVMNDSVIVNAYDKAIMALAKIQQYRSIGTVEELKQLKESAFTGMELAQIAVMQMELKKYIAIGTVEECQEALEKQRVKKPVLNKNSNAMFCPHPPSPLRKKGKKKL